MIRASGPARFTSSRIVSRLISISRCMMGKTNIPPSRMTFARPAPVRTKAWLAVGLRYSRAYAIPSVVMTTIAPPTTTRPTDRAEPMYSYCVPYSPPAIMHRPIAMHRIAVPTVGASLRQPARPT